MKHLQRSAYLLLLVLITTSYALPVGGKKAAYKLHYRGTLQFVEGHYGRATSLFQRAYDLEPGNFNFALSLGLGLGRTGRTSDGLKILQSASLTELDPSFRQKYVLKLFFEGMVHAFAGQYHRAIPLYRQCIEQQKTLDEPGMLSLMHNALGYAFLLNQGKSDHGEGLPPHHHVHRRDLVRAREEFERALAADGSNEAARYNYAILSDSLGMGQQAFAAEAAGARALRSGNTYNNLPDNVSRALDFANYDEVVFLLDISGSMVQEKVVCKGETRFKVMKETMQLILNGMAPETRIGIGTIGGDCGTVPRLWFRTGELTRQELRQRLQFLTPDGTTPLLTILKDSPGLFSGSVATSKSIFLVSDGANVCAARGLDICAWAGELPGQHITINILTFLETNLSNTNAFAEYTCLTDQTQGRILYIDNYRCRLERYDFDLVETCQFRIPEFRRVACWGPAVKDLWAIFE